MNYDALLQPGEVLVPIDRSGWIVASKLMEPNTEAILDFTNHHPCLFDKPVRVVIERWSSNNLAALTLLTEGATDSYGSKWPVGQIRGWCDVLWNVAGTIRKNL